jgi:Mrp family chromosome partitioning ATPase
MDHSKLFKAFEKQKESRQLQPKVAAVEAFESKPLETEPKSNRILSNVLRTNTLMVKGASVQDIRNPSPMSASDMRKSKLIYSGMKNRAVLNAYRELRIKLLDKSDASSLTIMVTSVDSESHSIVTALNLAISFSLDAKSSALLVDCNPHGTDLQHLIKSKLDRGVTDYFEDEDLSLDQIIYPSGIDKVSVIPSGSRSVSAAEQFSSKEMEDLIYEIKNRYSDRFIIINAPPVLANSEARVLTRYCDHSVLTVPHGRASIDTIEESVAALGSTNVSGVIYQQ